MRFYAYLWLRKDGTPYYVGKGSGKRAYVPHWRGQLPVPEKSRVLILKRSSEQEAYATEIELIANWGRKDIGTGVLLNRSNGGDNPFAGHVHPKGQKSRLWGKKPAHVVPGWTNSTSFRRGHVGYKNSGNFVKGQMAWNAGVKMSPLSAETKAKMSTATKGRKKSAEHRANLSVAQHIRWHKQRGVVNPDCSLCQATGIRKTEE